MFLLLYLTLIQSFDFFKLKMDLVKNASSIGRNSEMKSKQYKKNQKRQNCVVRRFKSNGTITVKT